LDIEIRSLFMSQSVIQDGKIFVGKSVKPEYLDLKLANRHGLITGATGTGKTVTLQVLAEGFSRAGVPVFAADIKGDPRISFSSAPRRSDFPTSRTRRRRSCSGMCSVRAAIRSAPP
jgi:DNA helicase HerA-like ATPase